MGFTSFLDKLSGGRSNISEHEMDLLDPKQKAIWKAITEMITPYLQGEKTAETYPGSLVPEIPKTLQDYISRAQDVGYGKTSLQQAGQTTMERALAGQPLWETDMGAAQDYWQNAFYDPAMKRFMQDVLPQLRENFAGQGNYDSSGRYRAELREMGNVQTDLNAQLAQILWGEKQAGRTAQETALERALNTVPMLAGFEQYPQNILRDVGLMERGLGGEQTQEDYRKWLEQQPYSNPYLPLGQWAMDQNIVQPYLENWKGWESQGMQYALAAAAGYFLGPGAGQGVAQAGQNQQPTMGGTVGAGGGGMMGAGGPGAPGAGYGYYGGGGAYSYPMSYTGGYYNTNPNMGYPYGAYYNQQAQQKPVYPMMA